MQAKKITIHPGGLIKDGGNSTANKTGGWSWRHAVVDKNKCIKCHQCVLFCPEGCIKILDNGRDVEVDHDFCKGCLVCAVECPAHAISMKSK